MAYPKARPLNIVGSTPGELVHPDGDVWVFNGRVSVYPTCSAVFQMHQPVDWGGGWMRRWLAANTTIPIYMREAYPEVPMSTPYPFDSVFDMLKNVTQKGGPLRYFTSSAAWAIALAVFQERPRIDVYAIELLNNEYKDQSDCFAFWIGFAAGRGTKININCADNIFSQPLYGAQPLRK